MESLRMDASLLSAFPQGPLGSLAAAAQDKPASHPQLLIAIDQPSRLHAFCNLLRQLDFQMKLVYEEGGAIANILSHCGEHCLLVSSGPCDRALVRPARLVERLREMNYRGCIHLHAPSPTSEEQAAYQAAFVNRLPALPTDSFVDGVNALMRAAPARGGCLSILQMPS